MSKLLLDKELEIIRRFFDYDLSEEELIDFDNRLNSDIDFANEVENYRMAYNTIDQFVIKNRTEKPPEDSPNQQDSTQKKGSPLLWLFLILLVGLLLAGYFALNQNSKNNHEQVFAQADEYTRLMSDDILRGDEVTSTTEEEAQLKSIILSYQTSDANPTISALNDFILQSENITNEELAEWWIANIYLQQKDITNAKRILTRIKDNSNYNSRRKAASFLEQL